MPEIPVHKYIKLFEADLEPGETCTFACRGIVRSRGQRAETTTGLASFVPVGPSMIGFTDRRLLFMEGKWGRQGDVTCSFGLGVVTDMSASKARIHREGSLRLAFADGTAASVTLPGPDSRELVRFLASARA